MAKVVIVVKGGVVTDVLTDSNSVQVIVLDQDSGGVGEEFQLADVLGEQVALDTLRLGLPKYDPGKVEQAYRETIDCLEDPGLTRDKRIEVLQALVGTLQNGETARPTAQVVTAETLERVKRMFYEAGISDVDFQQLDPASYRVSQEVNTEGGREMGRIYLSGGLWQAETAAGKHLGGATSFFGAACYLRVAELS